MTLPSWRVLVVLGPLLALGCAAERPKLVEPRDTSTSAKPKPVEAARAEKPVTPAKVMFVSDFELARSMGGQYRNVTTWPLASGRVGYLDASHARVLATSTELKTLEPGEKFSSICVAKNGETTFAVADSPKSGLWTADAFDQPLRKIGEVLLQPRASEGPDDTKWIVARDKDTVAVTCSTGTIERIAPLAASAQGESFSPDLQLIGLGFTPSGRSACYMRAPAISPGWQKVADSCRAMERPDGTFQIEPESRTHQPQTCRFILATNGKKLPCSTPLGPKRERNAQSAEREPAVGDARFYAPSRAVIAGLTGELTQVAADGSADVTKRIGPPTLTGCAALLPTEPLFHCFADDHVDVVFKVMSDGSVHEELRRAHAPSAAPSYSGLQTNQLFAVTADGGVAVGGKCTGEPGNVACVRTASGAWHDVPFSTELVSALNRTAPSTALMPTPDGQLYVGTATMDGLLGGAVHVLLFRADKGPATVIDKIPAWVLGSLAGIASNEKGSSYSLSWTTSDRVRAWPLEREHPAFHTPEFCRFDIGLDGTFDADCVQGKLFAVGRLGLWEKSPGDFYETLDAGQTFRPVALPKGLVADADTMCTAIGCRIGPYFREGWGAP